MSGKVDVSMKKKQGDDVQNPLEQDSMAATHVVDHESLGIEEEQLDALNEDYNTTEPTMETVECEISMKRTDSSTETAMAESDLSGGNEVEMDMGTEEVDTEESMGDEMNANAGDLQRVKGIGDKSEEILKAKGVNTVSEFWDLIQNADAATMKELNREIRGFNKIVARVEVMMNANN